MRCGISTSCFFPENTLLALEKVIATGAPVTEIFINTFHEIEPEFVDEMYRLVEKSGIEVVAFHPCSSQLEGYLFASNYVGRLEDGLRLYRRFFEVCKQFGATYLNFHGDFKSHPGWFSLEEYASNFKRLAELGQEYGVTLCYENVVYCRLGDPARVLELHPLLGHTAAYTLDTKQLRRQGASLEEMFAAMGNAIRHVHISDFSFEKDCIAPGKGMFDFLDLVTRLKANDYNGDLIIELYQDGFTGMDDLVGAMDYINTLL